MMLPIIAYGNKILHKPCNEIDITYPNLKSLIKEMWKTLYYTRAVGLAAPQINHAIKLFIVDSIQLQTDTNENERNESAIDSPGIIETFINAKIISTSDKTWCYSEGCLSIPSIALDIERPKKIKIEYFDKNFNKKVNEYTGMTARIIQHEYDHTNGILITDHISKSARNALEFVLHKIAEGARNPKYKMIFNNDIQHINTY